MGKAHHSDQFTEATEHVEEVGIQLRKAREAHRLSIATAAASLHLSPRVIEALEGNDFKQFEPVYVRGYLRNYARLLELKADPLVQSYNQTLTLEHPLAPAHAPLPLDPPARKGGYLLLAAAALPLFLWLANKTFQTAEEWRKPPKETATDSLTAGSLKQETSAPALALPVQAANQSPPPLKPSQNTPEPPASSPGKAEPAMAENANATPLAVPASQGPATAANPPPAEPAAAAANPPPAQPVGLGPDNIAVRLSASAWVSIREQSGKRIVYENLPAGTERSYQGQAPFAVVLGNSQATQIEFNGQPYEPPRPKAGTVARFILGGPNSKN